MQHPLSPQLYFRFPLPSIPWRREGEKIEEEEKETGNVSLTFPKRRIRRSREFSAKEYRISVAKFQARLVRLLEQDIA